MNFFIKKLCTLNFLQYCLLFLCVKCKIEDRYNLNFLPWDLRPVQQFIGLWKMEKVTGYFNDIPPPNLIDFAINPIPKFGARTVNITQTYYNKNEKLARFDYGFMPVKNATRFDPRIHVAYLTTSSEGYSMMEQGFYKNNILKFYLKQFLKRSFDVGSKNYDFEIRQFERQFELIDFHHMTLKVRAETSFENENYEAFYQKILY